MDHRNPTTVTAYVSSLGLSALSLNLNELVAIGGLVLAAATCLINWRYKHLHYRLEAAKADAPKGESHVAEG